MEEDDPRPEPMVTQRGFLDMQVCVPGDWTPEEITRFANVANLCGTEHGWKIRTDPKLLGGDPVRQPCQDRPAFVHVMLDA